VITSQIICDNPPSCAATKHLNAKFEGALRKCRGVDGEDAFLSYWESAADASLVPGSYRALVTNPKLPMAVEADLW